ncbi:hypothetical protein BH11PLA2_BH11PLA2_14690 [soil metagenome]
MPAKRKIESITVVIAAADIGTVSMDKYIDRLLTAYYELPGIELETEIDVNPGDASSYVGNVKNADEPITDELQDVAKKILNEMQTGA